jgi:hypothetical protein
MVKTLSYAADKWERKTSNVGSKWKERTLAGDYCKGFSQFLGHPVSEVCASWRAGVEAVSPEQFNSAIVGKKSKYISGLEKVR